LAGYRVSLERITGSEAPWNQALIEELQSFPLGPNDDQTDALSLAFSKLDNDDLSAWARL
jgi:phage terminase large subunit-like protein